MKIAPGLHVLRFGTQDERLTDTGKGKGLNDGLNGCRKGFGKGKDASIGRTGVTSSEPQVGMALLPGCDVPIAYDITTPNSTRVSKFHQFTM